MSEPKYDRREFLKLAGAGTALAGAGEGVAANAKASRAGATASSADATRAPSSADLCDLEARELAMLIRKRRVSAREVMDAHLARIHRINPKVNAIVALLDDDRCRALAVEADRQLSRGERVGPLHGLPFAFKDLQSAVGFPYTRGSIIFRNTMPTEDSALVARLRKAGVLPIGKTNAPEFGMGSHTFNKVYGTTLNPYDLTKSAGGSSGGAAVAVTTGMLPFADGSDNGGSLRNPGNFNNIVGLRPSVGLVPVAPAALPFVGFGVNGPLGRTVSDTAYLLAAMAGPDPRDPATYPIDPAMFRAGLERQWRGTRIAWCPDLGGLPLEPRVRAVLAGQRKTFESLGCIVEDACPDLHDADSVFLTIRAFRSAAAYGSLLPQHRDEMKPEAAVEIEQGLALSGAQVSKAMVQQGQLLDRMRQFEEKYEFTVCAVNQVAPFDAAIDWPHSIDGVQMEHYVAWQKSAYWITATFRPAISVPAGFTPEGLPVGIQIVGRYRADASVLQMAYAFEQATGFGKRRPIVS